MVSSQSHWFFIYKPCFDAVAGAVVEWLVLVTGLVSACYHWLSCLGLIGELHSALTGTGAVP